MRDVKRVLFLQLPVPQLNQYKKTLNIPLGPAWLAYALSDIETVQAEIIAQEYATYLGDSALIEYIVAQLPDFLGLSLYLWNTDRSLYIAKEVKERTKAKIIIGGPEVTLDNTYLKRTWADIADIKVVGEGEHQLRFLFGGGGIDEQGAFQDQWDFSRVPSPYIKGILSTRIENVMLLETQRGCPYKCTYCYYPKSLPKVKYIRNELVLEAVRWALKDRTKEIYIMDPSFDRRMDFEGLLKGIVEINREKIFSLTTELRVETLTAKRADLMANANFNAVEIGLQSTSPQVLRAINREVDLSSFLKGVGLLKERGIETKIDLILGLPEETPDSFQKTLDFMVENGLCYDAELFLLSVLPGTKLRKNAKQMGITYNEYPPYQIISTKNFTYEDLTSAWFQAEEVLDTNFTPPPFLDIAYKQEGRVQDTIEEGGFVRKIILNRRLKDGFVNELSKRLFHPYQIFVINFANTISMLKRVLMGLTNKNPFTPLEIVIFEPPYYWEPTELYQWVALYPNQYLDVEFRFKLRNGERGCLAITIVSESKERRWGGYLTRQVFWWKQDRLPTLRELKAMEELDGILLDGSYEGSELMRWQERFYRLADEIPAISFSEEKIQREWIYRCYPEDFVRDPIFG